MYACIYINIYIYMYRYSSIHIYIVCGAPFYGVNFGLFDCSVIKNKLVQVSFSLSLYIYIYI